MADYVGEVWEFDKEILVLVTGGSTRGNAPGIVLHSSERWLDVYPSGKYVSDWSIGSQIHWVRIA